MFVQGAGTLPWEHRWPSVDSAASRHRVLATCSGPSQQTAPASPVVVLSGFEDETTALTARAVRRPGQKKKKKTKKKKQTKKKKKKKKKLKKKKKKKKKKKTKKKKKKKNNKKKKKKKNLSSDTSGRCTRANVPGTPLTHPVPALALAERIAELERAKLAAEGATGPMCRFWPA